ncbi:MAG: hypothetical protein R3Y19_04365 [Rikenellaceae bacterium]
MIHVTSEICSTHFAAYIRSMGITILWVRNHTPAASTIRNITAAIITCTIIAVEKVIFNLSLSPLPISKVKNLPSALDIELVSRVEMLTIPPTTP